MFKSNIHNKIYDIIGDLEKKGFKKEANNIKDAYIKYALDEDSELNTTQLENLAGGELLNRATNPLEESIAKRFKPTEVKPGAAVGGLLVGTVLDMGAHAAIDFFESSQGPYKTYVNYKKDLDKIMNIIRDISKDPTLDEMASDILKQAEEGLKILEQGKKISEENFGHEKKASYNNKQHRVAVLGDPTSQLPSFITEALIGSGAGAAVGALFGGIGAGPGALIGALGNVSMKAVEEIWYNSISDSGKIYLQAKDALFKVSAMSKALGKLDQSAADKLSETVNRLEGYAETMNLKNKEKGMLENLVQKVESMAGKGFDAAKSAVGLGGKPSSDSGFADVKDDTDFYNTEGRII